MERLNQGEGGNGGSDSSANERRQKILDAAMAGVELSIIPGRVQTVTMQRPSELRADHPIQVDDVHGGYVWPETGNLLVAGLLDPVELDTPVDPDEFDSNVDREFQLNLATRLSRRLPADSYCAVKVVKASAYHS